MSYPRRRRRRAGDELRPFFCFLYLSIALACFLLVMIVVQGQVPFSRAAYGVAAAPLLILLYDRELGEDYQVLSDLGKRRLMISVERSYKMKENKSLLNIGGSRAVLAQRTESDLSRALVAPRPDAKAVVAGWTSQESSRRSSGSSTCARRGASPRCSSP
uniref:Uncharacterized protein n=1 Tax=Zea mays TaxID=4577 RepID=A0A804LQP8_MAIZE